MELHYRLAAAADIPEICALIGDAIAEMERCGILQWDSLYPTAEDFARDIENNTLYLALTEDRLAAIYVISAEADDAYLSAAWQQPGETAYVLHRFCVSPALQHKGVGKQVLQHIEAQIRAMGYESVRLDVFTLNPYAQRLYRNNGYTVTGCADWRKGRFDLMEKLL